MKFISNSCPPESVGIASKGAKLTIPDQSMSLKEILERFVRNEKLPIDMGGEYIESDDDLGKVAHMDLVDKAEFIERQKELQKKYDSQEREKEKKRKAKVREEEREAIRKEEAEKLKNAPGKPGDSK